MTIVNLVETTWLTRYIWPIEIIFDHGEEFIGYELKHGFIEN